MRAHLPTRRTAPRGMTLTEMMVSTVVVVIVMAGALSAMVANQRQFAFHANINATQANVRFAASQLDRALSHAGFGIDGNYALEPIALDASGNELAAGKRDNSGPRGSDELVVQFADPGFRRTAAGVSSAGFTLDRALAPGNALAAGQRLLVLCAAAADFAYVTVAGYSPETRLVTLEDAPAAPFNQQAKLDASCFGGADTMVRRVERRHYFIAWFTERDGQLRPALMVRRGLDLDADGASDEPPDNWPDPVPWGGSANDAELVALDVEQLQIAYVMNRPSAELAAQYGLTVGPDADRNFVFGDSNPPDVPSASAPVWRGAGAAPSPRGPPLLNDPSCPSLVDGISHCGYGGARRFTGHPGNVRSVRYTLVGRTAQEVAERPLVGPEDEDGNIENKPASGAAEMSRHSRVRLSGTISLRNVFQLKHFPPPTENKDGA